MKARYKYRIYPNDEQKIKLAQLFGCCRVVWNDALGHCFELRKQGIKKPSNSDLQKLFITQAKKTEERIWLKEVSNIPLQQSLNDLNKAYENFFNSSKGKRKGKKVNPPKFKSKKSRQSARFRRDGETPKDVKKQVTTHNTVEDETQRPSTDVGGVYSYEAITERTVLRSQLRVRGDLVDNSEWLGFLKGTYRVGRTNKDDYGLVLITPGEKLEKVSPKETDDTSELTVWLLSDVLLRDQRLRPTVDLEVFRKELEGRLGVTLEQKSKVFARQNRLESWQTRWGLPRPSLVGLAAGTCMVYKVTKGKLDPVKLAELECVGVGDRRAEGYGQLCFNDELLMKDKITVDSKSSSNTEKSPSLSDSFNFESASEYARLIEKQAWKTAIDKKALELAANKKDRERILDLGTEVKGNLSKSKPSLTQLGAFKSVLRKLEKPGESIVVGWIDSVKKVTNRKDEWGNSLGKIEDLVKKEGTVWQYLNLQDLYPELTITKNGPEVLKRDLWSYAVWTLVDACVRAHKRDLEDSNSL